MTLKIHESFPGICGTCRHGSLAESGSGQFLLRCDWFGREVPVPIVRCSRYDDRRQPSLTEMRRTAWILQTDEVRKTVGFVSNRQWRKSNPPEVFLDDEIE